MSSPMNNAYAESQGPAVSTSKQRLRTYLNFPYLVTFLFFLKVAVIVMELGGVISVSVNWSNIGEARYYQFVAITGICVALIFILLNFVKLVEKTSAKIPWNLIEIGFNLIWAVLALIAASLVTDKARNYANMANFAAAAFFGFAIVLIYVLDSAIRLIKMKRGDVGFTFRTAAAKAQGSHDKNAPTY